MNDRSGGGARFPNETAEYRRARERLLQSEIALRRRIETVAAERRALPPGGVIKEDYVFEEGAAGGKVRLSELFGPHDTLVAYSFMFGPAMEQPCPSCASMLHSLDRAARDMAPRVSLAVIAKSPIARILAFARERDWRGLRLLSSATSSYNRDYHGEDAEGHQLPILNVFHRSGGEIRHAYATELLFAPSEPGHDQRHIDAIWPIWSLFDFTPEGRGDFRPKLDYG